MGEIDRRAWIYLPHCWWIDRCRSSGSELKEGGAVRMASGRSLGDCASVSTGYVRETASMDVWFRSNGRQDIAYWRRTKPSRLRSWQP